jgi:hypothetical protein
MAKAKITKASKDLRHPHAGKHFIVESGKLKGLSVKVVDFLKNQYQGKSIAKIAERKDIAPLIAQLKGRKFEVSETTLYVLGPDKKPLLLDDTEIQVVQQKKPALTAIEGGKDDSGEASGEDLRTPGGTSDEGRSVSSGTPDTEDTGEAGQVGQSDSEAGGGTGSTESSDARPDQPKAGSGAKSPKGSTRKGNSTK